MINLLQPREYQKAILETAKKKNTLVVLPTGLGKTLIALLLTIERLKQYPTSKVLLLAPTKPLVEQHYESFKKQLPELFAELHLFTGEIPAKTRQALWNTAEIIFSTPQCIANDVQHSLYSLEDVSLIIFDEAHHCLKNYDYTKVVDRYKNQAKHIHILGLTASPGSDPEIVKKICQHLAIEAIELRSRDSKDVEPYIQEREFQKHEVPFPQEFIEIRVLLKRIWESKVNQLRSRNLLFGAANKITLLKLQATLARQASAKNFNALFGMSLTAQAIKIAHALELLETQTLSGLDVYLQNLVTQAREKKTKGVQTLVKMSEFQAALHSLELLRKQGMEHPKIEELAMLVTKEIQEHEHPKIIIFTQFRETASIIMQRLNQIEKVKAALFVGQAKKANTGLSQKEQKEVIEKFKSGEINILCATSIGEEGLDIPEVNTVIFYEPIPSAIRTIQRAGRTARLSPGKLIILITLDTKDEIHHYTAAARERKMHKTIQNVQEEMDKPKPRTLKEFI